MKIEKNEKSIGYAVLVAAFVILGATSFGPVTPTQAFALDDDGSGNIPICPPPRGVHTTDEVALNPQPLPPAE